MYTPGSERQISADNDRDDSHSDCSQNDHPKQHWQERVAERATSWASGTSGVIRRDDDLLYRDWWVDYALRLSVKRVREVQNGMARDQARIRYLTLSDNASPLYSSQEFIALTKQTLGDGTPILSRAAIVRKQWGKKSVLAVLSLSVQQ